MGASWSLTQGCPLWLAPGGLQILGVKRVWVDFFFFIFFFLLLTAVLMLWLVAGSAELVTVSGSTQ